NECTYTSNGVCENGNYVYFNPTTGTKCTNYTDSQSNTGVKSGCMKWYVFNDTLDSTTVNLLLDHNTSDGVSWNSNEDYANGPTLALAQLKSDTSNWKGVETPTNYTYTSESINPDYQFTYTIDYTGYKARLITVEEVADILGIETTAIVGTTTYNLNKNSTCKEGDTSGCKYGWLYDRTNSNCTKYGCLNNSVNGAGEIYTASAVAEKNQTYAYAYTISYDGFLVCKGVKFSGAYPAAGRPVIEVSKSKL
ncbi:MAG: hypothetical protein NC181_04500, partial [Clostridium sp.]|nr:hypothetical protein [Clostridium sp.]MCM1444501.1 hypothetical protein [Candidatus Amulumruptor caecigallinarius]